jgi:hypothetical protein
MEINLTYDASVASAPAGFKTVVQAVAQYFDSQFSNPITITIDVGWGEVGGLALDPSALGESVSRYTNNAYSYAQIAAALKAHALTSWAKEAVATLPASDPTAGGLFAMPIAEAKALGLLSGTTTHGADGNVGFSSAPGSFDFSIVTNGGFPAIGEYNFFAVVAHEFSEILGRQMNLGVSNGGMSGDGSGYYPLDLFDYTSSGTRTFDGNTPSRYFSIDGGQTHFGVFNPGPDGDQFDWAANSANAFDAFAAFALPSASNPVSAVDLILMNILGYQPTPDFALQSGPILKGGIATLTVTNLSQSPAPPSTTGMYLTGGNQPSPQNPLLATVATPAIAAGGTVTIRAAITIPADSLPGFYSLGAIANITGITEQNTNNDSQIGSPIAVLDGANVHYLSNATGYLCYDFVNLNLAQSFTLDSTLFVHANFSGAGQSLTIDGGGVLELDPGGKLSVATVMLNAGSKTTLDTDLIYAGAWTQSGGSVSIATGDTLNLAGLSNSIAGVVSGPGALGVSAGETTFSSGASLSAAKIEVSGSATQVIVESSLSYKGGWAQTAGTLTVGSGATLKLTGAGVSLAGTVAGAGVVNLTGPGEVLKSLTLSVARTQLSAASAALSGTLNVTGLMTMSCPDLTVSGITQLMGGGTLQLSNLATNVITGTAATSLLENGSTTIVGAGHLGAGSLRLTNESGGIIDGVGSAGLIIDTGSYAVANAGLIEATRGGSVIIRSAVANAGTLSAAGGNLTVEGVVTGAGSVEIVGSSAAFASSFTESVSFGATGELVLADSTKYTGTISHFSSTGRTSLDLEDIGFGGATAAHFSGNSASGVLTVTDGTHNARIKLAGDYLSSTWTLSGDGHGGTLVVDPAKTAPLVAAMAGFPPAGSVGLSERTDWRRPVLSILAAPSVHIA